MYKKQNECTVLIFKLKPVLVSDVVSEWNASEQSVADESTVGVRDSGLTVASIGPTCSLVFVLGNVAPIEGKLVTSQSNFKHSY